MQSVLKPQTVWAPTSQPALRDIWFDTSSAQLQHTKSGSDSLSWPARLDCRLFAEQKKNQPPKNCLYVFYYRKGDCASVRSAAVCDPISIQTFPVPFWQSHQLCCWTVEIIGTLCRADTSGDSSMSLRGIRSRLRQGGGGGSGSGGGCDSDQGSPSRSASFFQQLAAFLGPDEPTSSKGSYSQEVSFSILLLFHIYVCVFGALFFSYPFPLRT